MHSRPWHTAANAGSVTLTAEDEAGHKLVFFPIFQTTSVGRAVGWTAGRASGV